HQPSYFMLSRRIDDDGLIDSRDVLGEGSIVFSQLVQGMLTTKYLKDIPEGSSSTHNKSSNTDLLSKENLEKIRTLNDIAESRGQTLAQMAIAWVLKKGRITSALIGASRPEQVIDCVGAINNLDFTEAELSEIDHFATDGGLNI